MTLKVLVLNSSNMWQWWIKYKRKFQITATLNKLSIFLDQKHKVGSQGQSEGPYEPEVKLRLQGGVMFMKRDSRKLLSPAGGHDSHGLCLCSNGKKPGCLLGQWVNVHPGSAESSTILDSVLDEVGRSRELHSMRSQELDTTQQLNNNKDIRYSMVTIANNTVLYIWDLLREWTLRPFFVSRKKKLLTMYGDGC